jgi:DNA ligase (NAD+)
MVLSEQTILKMIEAGYINKPWDIFDVTETEILKLDGFAKKSAKKIYENIQNARNCDFDRAIYASGIELVGRKISKDIAKEFKTWDSLKSSSETEIANRLSSIDGIGDNIIDSFINNIYLLEELMTYLNVKKPEEKQIPIADNPFAGKKIYGTGTFANYKKDELKWLLEDMGAEFTSGYAKSLDYLIVGSIKGSSKEDKARKDGIKILSEDEFIKMIGR